MSAQPPAQSLPPLLDRQLRPRAFQQVDVFTTTSYLGNPVAVVLDGSGLDDAQMQAFARWTNLSETTFVLAGTDAQADYHLRIFTPGGELAFAGHPTLGSCHAWLQSGGVPKTSGFVVQQCGVGLVKISRDQHMQAFAAPALRRSDPAASLLANVAGGLGIRASQIVAAQLLDNGTTWLGLLLDSPDTVLQLAPDFPALKQLGHKIGVAGVVPSTLAALGLLNPEWANTVSAIYARPEHYLEGKVLALRHRTKELVTLALIRLAVSDPDAAAIEVGKLRRETS